MGIQLSTEREPNIIIQDITSHFTLLLATNISKELDIPKQCQRVPIHSIKFSGFQGCSATFINSNVQIETNLSICLPEVSRLNQLKEKIKEIVQMTIEEMIEFHRFDNANVQMFMMQLRRSTDKTLGDLRNLIMGDFEGKFNDKCLNPSNLIQDNNIIVCGSFYKDITLSPSNVLTFAMATCITQNLIDMINNNPDLLSIFQSTLSQLPVQPPTNKLSTSPMTISVPQTPANTTNPRVVQSFHQSGRWNLGTIIIVILVIIGLLILGLILYRCLFRKQSQRVTVPFNPRRIQSRAPSTTRYPLPRLSPYTPNLRY